MWKKFSAGASPLTSHYLTRPLILLRRPIRQIVWLYPYLDTDHQSNHQSAFTVPYLRLLISPPYSLFVSSAPYKRYPPATLALAVLARPVGAAPRAARGGGGGVLRPSASLSGGQPPVLTGYDTSATSAIGPLRPISRALMHDAAARPRRPSGGGSGGGGGGGSGGRRAVDGRPDPTRLELTRPHLTRPGQNRQVPGGT